MCRILKDKQPKCFIAENVKGILTANQKSAFPLILEEFTNSGYDVKYLVLNSANFGVPQKRERVIMVGFRKDLNIDFSFPAQTIKDEKLLKQLAFNEGTLIDFWESSDIEKFFEKTKNVSNKTATVDEYLNGIKGDLL